MKYLNKFKGAVFFVDILGIGALTRNLLHLKKEDYSFWLQGRGLEKNPQHLAAAVLSTFRELLNELDIKYANVKIAQLSDCAFIWSANVTDVLSVTHEFMWKAIDKGLLCRGGLSYGEILETAQNYGIGKFIIGEAVTNAVKLEALSKGARVLINQDFPSSFDAFDKNLSAKVFTVFKPFTNPLDYQEYDEFQWYLVPSLQSKTNSIIDFLPYNQRLQYTKDRLKLVACLRSHPAFSWNCTSLEGLVHMKATLMFLSQSNLLGVHHEFEGQNVTEKRSNTLVNSFCKAVDDDEEYRNSQK